MRTYVAAILALVGSFGFAPLGYADDDDDLEFEARLSGAQEVTTPPGGVDTDASARVKAEFTEDLSRVRVSLRVRNATGVTAGHFHCGLPGVNGPVVFGFFSPGPCNFDGEELTCVLTNENLTDVDNRCAAIVGRPVSNIAALAFAMREGLIYANVHTTAHPGGEVRGQMLPDDD